jgi:hypothetical protein
LTATAHLLSQVAFFFNFKERKEGWFSVRQVDNPFLHLGKMKGNQDKMAMAPRRYPKKHLDSTSKKLPQKLKIKSETILASWVKWVKKG